MISYAERPSYSSLGHEHMQSRAGVSSEQYSGQRSSPCRQRNLDERRNAVEICVRPSSLSPVDTLRWLLNAHCPPTITWIGPCSSPLSTEKMSPIQSNADACWN